MTQTLKTYSPVDNSLYIERPYTSVEELQVALSKANKAQHEWKHSSFSTREKQCHAAIDYLVANQEAIGKELCWQIGRPIRYAQNELKGLEERARYMIEQARASLAEVRIPN